MVVVAVFDGGEQVCLGWVVAVGAACGVPCMLSLESGEVRFAGLALVGVEVGLGKMGSEFAEFYELALDRPVGVEAGGDEQVGEVESAEAMAVVVALDVAEDVDGAQSIGQGGAVAGVDRISRGVQRWMVTGHQPGLVVDCRRGSPLGRDLAWAVSRQLGSGARDPGGAEVGRG